MQTRKEIIDLLENKDNTSAFEFYDFFDGTKRGAYFVLNYLNNSDKEVISVDLSNSLNVSTARMTKILQKLEKNELITKSKSSSDARKIIISITEQGRKTLESFQNLVLDCINCIISEIGKDNFERFLTLSRDIQNVMEKRNLLDKFKV